MFSSKITCSKCNKEIDENDKIAIIVQAKKLNGITNVKAGQKIIRFFVPSATI